MIRSKAEMERYKKKYRNLVVIFGHPLCGPCQQIMMKLPYYMYKAVRNKYTLKFCNINELKSIAKEYGITITPTLIYFKQTEEYKRYDDPEKLLNFLSK